MRTLEFPCYGRNPNCGTCLGHLKGYDAFQVCTGKMNWKVAPRSAFGVAHSRPPCASKIERLIAKPMPMPQGLVVWKAAKIRSASSGSKLISKVRVSSLDRARDAIDLVAAAVDARFGIVEHAIFGPELVEGRTPTRGVVFTENVGKVAGQQGRYAVRHDRHCGTKTADPPRRTNSALSRARGPDGRPRRCR